MPATAVPARYCDRCGARLARDNRAARCGPCSSPRALREPPVVPGEFWDAPPMRAALDSWHMGRVIYAYRTHPWHGQVLKQSVVGSWFGLTQTQLSRIENGRAPEEMSKLVRWARLLGIPAERLWFKLPGDDSAGLGPAATLTLPVIVAGRTVLLPVDEAAARACGLEELLSQLADPDRVRGPLDGYPLPAGVPFQPERTAATLSAPDADEVERVAAALDDARRYLDVTVVGLFRGHLERGMERDGQQGPAKALPLVLGILGAISEHVRDVKPDVRAKLLSLGAEGAEFAGWLYRDLKDAGNATYWYDRSMEWAHEASDLPMQGYVLLRKSQMAYDTRDAHRVVTFAEAAFHGPWQLSASVKAEVAQQQALGLAMTGTPIGVVEEHMAAAQALLGQVPCPDARTAPPCGTLTMDTLLLRQAACYTEAGKPAKAAQLFGDVLASGSLSKRDAGFFGARRAVALALSGEPDEAAAVGLAAVAAARETSSERTMRLLNDVLQALRSWSSRPAPAALRHAVLTSSR
jgi:transcriptional regulator with XRE-family HTH domain